MAEHRYLANPHPRWKEFPNNLPPGTTIDKMTRDHEPIKPEGGLDIDEIDCMKSGEERIILRRYQQSMLPKDSAVLLYMHGGGFVTGGLETDDRMCRQIALQVPVTVLSVEYRLAPEHHFPTGFEDCLNVIRWLISPSGLEFLNVNLKKGFVLGGTSAGGNLTAGLAHAMLEQGLEPQPTGLLFIASSFCHPDVRPSKYKDRIVSVDEIDDAPGLTIKSIRHFAGQYGAPPDDKRYSPLLYQSRRGLSDRAFFQICGWDPRRDEAILYAQLLRDEGIEIQVKTYKGLPHGFWTTCPGLPESEQALQDTVEGMRWLVGG